MNAVKEVLELNLVKFQSGSGVTVESFLTVLDLYLKSTVLEYNNRKYIQKEGVCIGSSVAPLLAEIYLNSLDRVLFDKMIELSPNVGFIRRYVDDIFVCTFEE
ncbi:Reverse transcriptase (RNA-dependent DNA polymerase) [Ixodes scapularis]